MNIDSAVLANGNPNGVLYIDRMEKDVLAAIDPELKALKKATREAAKK